MNVHGVVGSAMPVLQCERVLHKEGDGTFVATERECACNMPKCISKLMRPLELRFTHKCISHSFRGCSESLADVVDQIVEVACSLRTCLRWKYVNVQGLTWSLSIRRLCVARVIAHKGQVITIPVCEHSPGSAYLTTVRHCDSLNRFATK